MSSFDLLFKFNKLFERFILLFILLVDKLPFKVVLKLLVILFLKLKILFCLFFVVEYSLKLFNFFSFNNNF